MLTLHTAELLLPGHGLVPLPGGAVAVRGREIAALGTSAELAGRFPGARVRRWPGLLTPGLVNPWGPELLEGAYHPDPREAAELGTEPLTGAALDALALTGTRWGGSARRGVQRMLAHGTVAVAGTLERPFARDAVDRSGLARRQRSAAPSGPVSLDPLAGRTALAPEVFAAARLSEGAPAAFAVFDVLGPGGAAPGADPCAALAARGAGRCVATVLGGRLVHRRR
ncbi:hypothetical protein NPS70_25575 [Streptomyces sp. C10-9-1]|uniref:imidazolonepropionase-like domain-containing protein n=1 Tax=Streptomyces sp. C10-9-1 TaxID=1859285 RepID=UPI002111FCCE|nr:hypothetical protein [Streptomyces sp. C10-9-1]MCQ6556525.1 hypothetical protein [Streptomyces sp. C10-9-1]